MILDYIHLYTNAVIKNIYTYIKKYIFFMEQGADKGKSA